MCRQFCLQLSLWRWSRLLRLLRTWAAAWAAAAAVCRLRARLRLGGRRGRLATVLVGLVREEVWDGGADAIYSKGWACRP